MARGVFRFRTVERPALDELALDEATRGGVLFDESQPMADAVELMRQDPPMSVRDETIFLLQTAAEIEHSLLVHYLYAGFSLDAMNPDGTVNANRDKWRSSLIEIAREEMAHLLSVQNLLRSLGGPENLEREDFPFNVFYPFRFQLAPF